jgi:hypothetical protein
MAFDAFMKIDGSPLAVRWPWGLNPWSTSQIHGAL